MLWMGNSIQNTLLHRHWSISSLKNKPKYCLYSTHTYRPNHTYTQSHIYPVDGGHVIVCGDRNGYSTACEANGHRHRYHHPAYKYNNVKMGFSISQFRRIRRTECVCVVVCMRVERSTICWWFPNKPNASANALCQTRDMFTLFRFRFDGTATERKTIAKFYKNNNNVYMWKWSLENRRHQNVRCGVLGPHPITSPAYGKESRWWDAI